MGGFASPSIIKPAPVCPPLGLPSYPFWGSSLAFLAGMILLFLGLLPCVPCLLRMLAGGFLVLVQWLQPKKAPSQQAQSPRPPRLRAVCPLGLVQWLQPQETASPQAPVCPPLGLPIITLFVGVNKMVLLDHVRPIENCQESLESWRPICRSAGRFGSLLSPCAQWRARLRALNIHHGKEKIFSMERKNLLHGKKKSSPWKEKIFSMEKKACLGMVKS